MEAKFALILILAIFYYSNALPVKDSTSHEEYADLVRHASQDEDSYEDAIPEDIQFVKDTEKSHERKELHEEDESAEAEKIDTEAHAFMKEVEGSPEGSSDDTADTEKSPKEFIGEVLHTEKENNDLALESKLLQKDEATTSNKDEIVAATVVDDQSTLIQNTKEKFKNMDEEENIEKKTKDIVEKKESPIVKEGADLVKVVPIENGKDKTVDAEDKKKKDLEKESDSLTTKPISANDKKDAKDKKEANKKEDKSQDPPKKDANDQVVPAKETDALKQIDAELSDSTTQNSKDETNYDELFEKTKFDTVQQDKSASVAEDVSASEVKDDEEEKAKEFPNEKEEKGKTHVEKDEKDKELKVIENAKTEEIDMDLIKAVAKSIAEKIVKEREIKDEKPEKEEIEIDIEEDEEENAKKFPNSQDADVDVDVDADEDSEDEDENDDDDEDDAEIEVETSSNDDDEKEEEDDEEEKALEFGADDEFYENEEGIYQTLHQ